MFTILLTVDWDTFILNARSSSVVPLLGELKSKHSTSTSVLVAVVPKRVYISLPVCGV